MKTKGRAPRVLEDLPSIGKRIAADLRAIGIREPGDLQQRKPLEVYHRLEPVMGERHDPCVFYTLLAVEHYTASGEVLPWWEFTKAGREVLEEHRTWNVQHRTSK